jgi:hypothetical protein
MTMPARKLICQKRPTGHGSPKSPQRQGCPWRKREVLLREPDLPPDLPQRLLRKPDLPQRLLRKPDLPPDLPKRPLRPPHLPHLPLRV